MSGFKKSSLILDNKSSPVVPQNNFEVSVTSISGNLKVTNFNEETKTIAYIEDLGSSGLNWLEVASNTTLNAFEGALVDTSSTSIEITLPATPELGDTCGVMDTKGDADTNPITVIGTFTANISGNLVIDVPYSSFELVWNGEAWQIITFINQQGSGETAGEIDYSDEVTITAATTLDNEAFGKSHIVSGSSDYIVTLPAVSGNKGKLISFHITGTALFTIKGNASELIDGENERVMWKDETATLLCDGGSWRKVAGKSIPFEAVIKRNADQSLTASTVTKILFTDQIEGPAYLFDDNGFKCPRPSNYFVQGAARLNNNSGTAFMALTKNGIERTAEPNAYPQYVNNSVVSFSVATVFKCDKDDALFTAIFTNTSSNSVFNTDNRFKPTMKLNEIPGW